MAESFATIDAYVAAQPAGVRPVLEEIRDLVLRVVPEAGEAIRYQMPTMTLDGASLVHFAAWKRHVSVYPTAEPSDDAEFEARFAPYRGEKGTAKFPLSAPVPFDLIERQVELLVAQRRS